MKAVILAGGFGTRISEESYLRPKPMIEIGGHPILWHIMKLYYSQGVDEFIICAGYKQHMIKEYFSDYYLHCSDVTFDFSNKNQITIHNDTSEDWKVTIVDTGLNTMTGGRIKRIKKYLDKDEPFLLTYGDGVSDVDVRKLIEFHKRSGKIATLTAVHPAGRGRASPLMRAMEAAIPAPSGPRASWRRASPCALPWKWRSCSRRKAQRST